MTQRLAEQLGCSVQTAHRYISGALSGVRIRKRRSDRNTSDWTNEELKTVSGFLLETNRQTGKQLGDVAGALDTLRANRLIRGESIDVATGEVRLLSPSSCAKALRANRLHPGQLRAPTPKISLSTEHPNQVWQADPSLCVLYYLKRTAGLCAMPVAEFNKNKPKNLDRIANDRVWRYVFTDHASGAFYVEYVLGAESGANLCSTFINAMQRRGADDPMCGAPRMIMVDPGSANTSAMFKNLCAALGVQVWVNQPGQPWAKGQVEKTNDLVERKFEHRLRFQPVPDLDALNIAAWAWMRNFNATAQHSRHKSSRYQAWMTITPAQLRIPPNASACMRLATRAPEDRVVNALLQISFRGRKFDVSGVPGVIVGEKLRVASNAFSTTNGAQVLITGEDDRDTWYEVEPLLADSYGFINAVPVGTFHAHRETPADTNRKAVERLVMGAETDGEAVAKRKARALPFGGAVDASLSIAQAPSVAHLPRAGTAIDVQTPDVRVAAPRVEVPAIRAELAPLNTYEAATRLKPLVERSGHTWTAEMYARTAERWADGLPIDQVEAWATELTTQPRNGLRVVGGAA
ncbi:hypothetical protein [Lysobacter sp. CA199]|uniref:hypothetical protein n=1 Tax=Lysobacter sp. CA199 TaxID=3455608 RepID=UPI003F8D0571